MRDNRKQLIEVDVSRIYDGAPVYVDADGEIWCYYARRHTSRVPLANVDCVVCGVSISEDQNWYEKVSNLSYVLHEEGINSSGCVEALDPGEILKGYNYWEYGTIPSKTSVEVCKVDKLILVKTEVVAGHDRYMDHNGIMWEFCCGNRSDAIDCYVCGEEMEFSPSETWYQQGNDANSVVHGKCKCVLMIPNLIKMYQSWNEDVEKVQTGDKMVLISVVPSDMYVDCDHQIWRLGNGTPPEDACCVVCSESMSIGTEPEVYDWFKRGDADTDFAHQLCVRIIVPAEAVEAWNNAGKSAEEGLLRAELVSLRDRINEDLVLPRTQQAQSDMKTYWVGYLACLRDIHMRHGRIIPWALSCEENNAFGNAIAGYSGAGLSIEID